MSYFLIPPRDVELGICVFARDSSTGECSTFYYIDYSKDC